MRTMTAIMASALAFAVSPLQAEETRALARAVAEPSAEAEREALARAALKHGGLFRAASALDP